jgi:histidine triad (HIT) family protein
MPIEIPVRERCAFCLNESSANWAHMVEELDETCAFLNPRQYGIGAMLVIPRRHAPTVLDLEVWELEAIYRHVRRLAQALTSAFDPAGLNIFQNNGITAGQTVPHYHVHIVPSYPGDPPGKVFSSAEFERTPREELARIANQIIPHLPD